MNYQLFKSKFSSYYIEETKNKKHTKEKKKKKKLTNIQGYK